MVLVKETPLLERADIPHGSTNKLTAANTDGARIDTRNGVYNVFNKMYVIALELKGRFMKSALSRHISHADAEEIFQEVMTWFWERIDSINTDGNLRALIWRRLYGALLDRGRQADHFTQRQRKKLNPF